MNLLFRLLKGLQNTVSRWLNAPYRTVIVDDQLPQILKRRTLYLVRDDGDDERAAMICPCGCGRVLHMNLLPDERPRWHVRLHADGTASLHPSVWRKTDCRSHFWFRNGRVVWCKDDVTARPLPP